MSDFDYEQHVLHSPFDIDIHKHTFTNYLEVLILEEGTVTYAVPSHQELLITLSCKKLRVSRSKLYDMCPKEYWFDFMTWLSMQCDAIPVWDFRFDGVANEAQLAKLNELKDAGLYSGPTENKLRYV